MFSGRCMDIVWTGASWQMQAPLFLKPGIFIFRTLEDASLRR